MESEDNMETEETDNCENVERASDEEVITRLRLDLFSRKASEQSTVPLTSVLKLQYCRSCLVVGLLEKHHGD